MAKEKNSTNFTKDEWFEELNSVRREYIEKFNEDVPASGWGLSMPMEDYINLLKKAIKENKKIVVKQPKLEDGEIVLY